MSYFSENPEKWDEIELTGVLNMILDQASAAGDTPDEVKLRDRLEVVQQRGRGIWDEMISDAQNYIEAGESAFWGSMGR